MKLAEATCGPRTAAVGIHAGRRDDTAVGLGGDHRSPGRLDHPDRARVGSRRCRGRMRMSRRPRRSRERTARSHASRCGSRVSLITWAGLSRRRLLQAADTLFECTPRVPSPLPQQQHLRAVAMEQAAATSVAATDSRNGPLSPTVRSARRRPRRRAPVPPTSRGGRPGERFGLGAGHSVESSPTSEYRTGEERGDRQPGDHRQHERRWSTERARIAGA